MQHIRVRKRKTCKTFRNDKKIVIVANDIKKIVLLNLLNLSWIRTALIKVLGEESVKSFGLKNDSTFNFIGTFYVSELIYIK